MTWGRSEEGWTWMPDPSVVLGSSYPARVDTSTPGDVEDRPVGFTAALAAYGTPKPATESLARVCEHDGSAHVLGARPGCPVVWTEHEATLHDRPNVERCDECGDCDGHHFRCCSHSPHRTNQE